MRYGFWALGLAVIVGGLSSGGCATIVHGPTQSMNFQSVPDGATVTMVGTDNNSVLRQALWIFSPQEPPVQLVLGKTPLTVQLQRSEWPQTVLFSKDGYHDVAMKIDHHISGWYFGNILVGGYVGSTTDIASGAGTEYAPNQFFASLYKIGSNSLEQETTLSAKEQTRIFVIRRHDSLRADLSRGTGEDLGALLARLQIAPSSEQATKIRLGELNEEYSDAVEFATKVVEMDWANPTRTVAAHIVTKQQPTKYWQAR